MTTPELIDALLLKFKDLTGMEPNPRIHERSAFEFIQIYGDESVANMEIIVRHIQSQNRKGDFKLSLRIDKILNDLERSDGILSEAKALHRNRRPKPTPAEAIKEAWSPTVVPRGMEPSVTTPAMTNLIKAMKEAAK